VTINKWQHLLEEDAVKKIIIDSLKYLVEQKKIEVYGFVIMPNHIHLIWQTLALNGKESAQGSFLKFTAHAFKKYLMTLQPNELKHYSVEASNKNYEFWQRDPLAFKLSNIDTTLQKLNYIHNNPLAQHWLLATEPINYFYSSALFYENGKNDFGFLKNIVDVF
ncbi:MAG: hypothetical protein RIQ33_1519, partial [Bacteroidota bacterium]